MDFPLSPTQDINIRVKNVRGQSVNYDDTTKDWMVQVTLELDHPVWNIGEDGRPIDPEITVVSNRSIGDVRSIVKVTRVALAAKAGLASPDDVATMPAAAMESAIIAVAMEKVHNTFGIVFG